MKAYTYLRVSGRGQIDGDGFPRQAEAINKYATANGIEVVEEFREKGVSGTKDLDDRPALAELLAALEENGVKTILIEKLDRLARDLMVQEAIIADMAERGYTLISVYEPDLCSDDPSRKLMRQIMGAFAEYEKTMIVQKLRAARVRKKAKTGKGEGRHAFGEKPEEVQVLEQIKFLRAAGLTCEQIATDLNALNIPTRKGGPWLKATVAKIVRREAA